MTVSQAALERYGTRLRRERAWYALAIALLVVAASVIATVIWLSGEISHTTLKTVGKAPGNVGLATAPNATQHLLWSTTDRPALGIPYVGGSVVTYNAHTVRGHDGRTGVQTWSYTRTDRTVCTAMQDAGNTIAVYRLNGNCDEVTALDTATGKREWTRTLDMDTHQLNGQPQFAISNNEVMIVSPTAVYTIDTPSGYLGWIFAEAGCTVEHAILGSTGALISQTCAHRDCTEVKHCLNGPQLVLRDPVAGQNTDSSKNNGNPDMITWAIANPDGLVPASAGQIISAYSADGSTLTVLNSKSGKVTGTTPLHPRTGDLSSATDYPLSDGELLYAGGVSYALTGQSGTAAWALPSTVSPTVTSGAIPVMASLGQTTMTMPSVTGAVQLDPNTGKVARRYALNPVPSPTARIYPYGKGFIVAGDSVSVFG